MPVTLLPASAAAFAPRGNCNVVLNKKVEPWLTQTLKRINKIKRPLNSVAQHHRCLTETLSAPSAIWLLCSILLPKAPELDLRKDDNPLVEALFNYQWLHVEAYLVSVDMVSRNEVAFKLTEDTIEALTEYHKDIFTIDEAAATHHWAEKEVQLKKLHDDFVQAANQFVFRFNAKDVLEGLEEDGMGELLAVGASEVKNKILGMFHSLMPPPPRQVEVIQPAPVLRSSAGTENWWPSNMIAQQQQPQLPQQPHDPWSNVSSSPTPSGPTDPYSSSGWMMSNTSDTHTLSPSPIDSPVFTPDCFPEPDIYVPNTCAPMSMPFQYPSMLISQQVCENTSGFGGCGAEHMYNGQFGGGFGYTDFAMPMPALQYTSAI